MTTTSHTDFNSQTESLDVAKAFAGMIRGKTVVVTGVNRGGIGFSTAEAFVSTVLPELVPCRRLTLCRPLNRLPIS